MVMQGANLEGIIQVTLSIVASFIIVYKSVPLLIKIAYLKDLYDKPDGDRKVHTRYIPTLGGIGIFIAFSIGFLMSGFSEGLDWLPYLIGSSLGLFFCGLKDDLVGLSPTKKLIVQVIACTIVLFTGSLFINSLGGVLGIGEIPIWVSIPLSLFTMIVIINSFNLIDGIDGLAGGIGAISSFVFSGGFFIAGEIPLAILGLTLGVVLVGYLFHNFHPASIFMGDTGSLIVGFLLSVLALSFIDLSSNANYSQVLGNSSPVLPVAILALPLYDTIRSFTRRVRRGKSPFDADSDHIHHALLKMGWGQKRTVLYLYCAAGILILVGLLSADLNVNVSLLIVLLTTTLVFPTNGFKRNLFMKIGLDIASFLRPSTNVDTFDHLTEIPKKPEKKKKSLIF